MMNNRLLTKYIHKLKFDLELDTVFINDDDELVEMLMGEVGRVKQLREELDKVKLKYEELLEELEYFKTKEW